MKKGNSENLEGKRGKKGGTQFPRYSLEHLHPLLKSLASKTHTNTITIEQLNAGVFGVGANSPVGKVKSSALKQFGLITGDYKKIKSSELTSRITMSDGDELKKNLQEAFGKVSVFVNALNTFQNSKIEKSRIGQYAVSTLKVHPDMMEDFTTVLIESAKIAGLCTLEGTTVTFASLSASVKAQNQDTQTDENIESEDNSSENEQESTGNDTNDNSQKTASSKKTGQVSNINVNIDVDPSMDPEKLEKLLKLLKNYGAI